MLIAQSFHCAISCLPPLFRVLFRPEWMRARNGQLFRLRSNHLTLLVEHPASLVSVRPNGLEDTAQFKLEVDQEKAQALGVSLSDINQTISTALGGTYVNDFIDRGRVKKVYVQADAKFRMLPEDVDKRDCRYSISRMKPNVRARLIWRINASAEKFIA